jgi:hypothetical protein
VCILQLKEVPEHIKLATLARQKKPEFSVDVTTITGKSIQNI